MYKCTKCKETEMCNHKNRGDLGYFSDNLNEFLKKIKLKPFNFSQVSIKKHFVLFVV